MEEQKIFEKRWQLASSEQRARYNNLMSSYPTINWTYKEKKYLLWLCQLDIDTFEQANPSLDSLVLLFIDCLKAILSSFEEISLDNPSLSNASEYLETRIANGLTFL